MKGREPSRCYARYCYSAVPPPAKKASPPEASPEYKFETDCQYYNYFAGAYYLAEGEDGYYYEENGFLRFIDKNSMESVVLCNKPECLHDQMNTNIVEELSNCNAYVGAIYDRCLHYYKGNLYALVKNYGSSQSSFARSLVCISFFQWYEVEKVNGIFPTALAFA